MLERGGGGVPFATYEYLDNFVSEITMGEVAAELLKMLIKMEDVQASLQNMRLSASTVSTRLRLFLLRTLPPTYATRAAENFVVLLELAFASMVARGGRGGGGLAKVGLGWRAPRVCRGTSKQRGNFKRSCDQKR